MKNSLFVYVQQSTNLKRDSRFGEFVAYAP